MTITIPDPDDDDEAGNNDSEQTPSESDETPSESTVEIPQVDEPLPVTEAVNVVAGLLNYVTGEVEKAPTDGELELEIDQHSERIHGLEARTERLHERLETLRGETDILTLLSDVKDSDASCPKCDGVLEVSRGAPWMTSGVECSDCGHVAAALE